MNNTIKLTAIALLCLGTLANAQISEMNRLNDNISQANYQENYQKNHQGCFDGHSAQISLDNNRLNTLVDGKISFTHNDDLTEITLYFDNRQKQRLVFSNKVTEQNFVVWHSNANDRLILTSENPTKACYHLSLEYTKATLQKSDYNNDKPISPALITLQQHLTKQKLSQFWQMIGKQGTPLIEQVSDKTLMTFLWRETEPTVNVRLLGSPSNDHEWLDKLPNSDVWYKSFWVKDGLVLSYEFAPSAPTPAPNPRLDDNENRYKQRRAMLAKLTHDPLNPQRFGNASWAGVNVKPPIFNAHQGKLTRRIFTSQILNNKRRLWLYQTKITKNPIVLYLFDGDEYLHKVGIASVLDEFSKRTGIGVLAVLIDNVNRRDELPMNEQFAQMMSDELVPFVARTAGIRPNPTRTVIAGSSYGGLASAFVAYRYPSHFGNVLPMSGSFWYKNAQGQAMSELLTHYQNPAQKWHMMAGSYETHRTGETVNDAILGSSQALTDMLNTQGNQATFRIYEGGHDYAVWRVALLDGLERLFVHSE